ncbi:hypothetical protein QQP08_017693 [Theobroma cacao]|nr:hypothetical protein QQP08_017693 [Theobroma cacao]
MEFGSFLMLGLSHRLKNLKCFKLPILLGNISRLELDRLSTRKYWNLLRHVSTKDLLLGPVSASGSINVRTCPALLKD